MAAIGLNPNDELYNFVIMMAKYVSEDYTYRCFDHKPTFDEAKLVADKAASDGFGCVVISLDNRCQVYEMNQWMQKPGIKPPNVPQLANNEDYMKFERTQLENEVRGHIPATESQAFTVDELKVILTDATNNKHFFPRLTGQTPADRIKDYDKVEIGV